MTGKEKCNFLRELRKKISEDNNIKYDERPCTFSENCSGTCPKCEKELSDLTNKINKLHIPTMIGASLLSVSLVGCTPVDINSNNRSVETSTMESITKESIPESISESDVCIENNKTLSGDVIINEDDTDYVDDIVGDIVINE